MNTVTIITTIDFKDRAWELLVRSYTFFKNAKKIGVQVVIGHADRGTLFDKIFLRMQKKVFPCFQVCSIKYYNKHVNNSMLRNAAFKKVKSDLLIISDIDLYFDKDVILYMINECIKNEFSIMPCLYLSKFGTYYLKFCKNKECIINKWLNWEFNYFLHIAIPSSFMCLKSIAYKKIGGFDEEYTGHGYEDFDFIIRLIRKYYDLELSLTDNFDKTYVAPLFAQGFRADLAAFCLKAVLDKKIVLHKFHKKNKLYYNKEREYNKGIFYNKFFHRPNDQSLLLKYTVPKLLEDFYSICKMHNFDPESFSILFNDCPRWKLFRNTHSWR